MNIKTLSNAQAEIEWLKWKKRNYEDPILEEPQYDLIRTDLTRTYNKVKNALEIGTTTSKYNMDVNFGLYLYQYFSQNWFSLRLAENDDFWRYLSVIVVPRLVADRWDENQDDHFFSRGTRIWLKSLWWYVYLSWQGDYQSTEKILLSKNMNTDIIQNFVERSGRNGVYVEVYRKIIKYYSEMKAEEIKLLEKKIKQDNSSDTFFRNVMKLNTAKMLVVEPGLFDGGENGYVLSIFNELGAKIDEA